MKSKSARRQSTASQLKAEQNEDSLTARRDYRRIADFLKQLTPVELARTVELERDWTPELIFRMIGHLDAQQRKFIVTLEGTTVEIPELIQALNIVSGEDLTKFLSELDKALIGAGLHPSEVYQARYTLAEDDSLETKYTLVEELDKYLIVTDLQYDGAPLELLTRGFFSYCYQWGAFGHGGLDDSLREDIWRDFQRTAKYVIGPWNFHSYAPLPAPEVRCERALSLARELVPLLRAAAIPKLDDKTFDVAEVYTHDFAEEMRDDYVYRALFTPALSASAARL